LTVFIAPPLENRFWIEYDVDVSLGMRGGSATRFANLLLSSTRYAVGSIARLPCFALDGPVAF
jgi:hypothetical protein